MTYLYFFNNIILMGHIVLLTKRVLKKFLTVYSFHISCIVQSAQKRVKSLPLLRKFFPVPGGL